MQSWCDLNSYKYINLLHPISSGRIGQLHSQTSLSFCGCFSFEIWELIQSSLIRSHSSQEIILFWAQNYYLTLAVRIC